MANILNTALDYQETHDYYHLLSPADRRAAYENLKHNLAILAPKFKDDIESDMEKIGFEIDDDGKYIHYGLNDANILLAHQRTLIPNQDLDAIGECHKNCLRIFDHAREDVEMWVRKRTDGRGAAELLDFELRAFREVNEYIALWWTELMGTFEWYGFVDHRAHINEGEGSYGPYVSPPDESGN